VAANPQRDVIAGFGFNEFFFLSAGENGGFVGGPTKEMLDDISTEKPIFLVANSGHAAWANSRALEMLNITRDTPDPQPGAHVYVRDENGDPTGWLAEGEAFWSHLPTLGLGTKEQMQEALEQFLPQLPQYGLTSIYDAGTPAIQENTYSALIDMESRGNLPLRYFGSNYLITRTDAQNATVTMRRIQETYTTNQVRPVTLKFSNDGFIAAPGELQGVFIQFREEELSGYIGAAMQANQDLMIHASAGTTVEEAVNAIEIARAANGASDSRQTITHVGLFGVADVDQLITRMATPNIIVDIQPGGGFEGGGGGPVYPLAQMYETGLNVTISSDYPASGPLEVSSPLHVIRGGLTQNAEFEDLIRSMTLTAAYHVRMEDELGSLEVGKQADLIILDDNLFDRTAENIAETNVVYTMIDGRVTHNELPAELSRAQTAVASRQ